MAYVLEIDLQLYAIPFTTLVLAFSFAYQNLLQDIVDNLYTLFFVRPYNIGDLIELNGQRYYVEEVGLLSSACRHEGKKKREKMKYTFMYIRPLTKI